MHRTSVALAAALLVGAARPASAQLIDHLSIHGYLSQAYGVASGGTVLGIPTTGTTDYRTLALQFRYDITAQDYLTIQLNDRALGVDSATAGQADVRLDWAFYGHSFGDFGVKVGRVPIPAGIYNEVRNVGVVLPLYRAPFNFYLEGSFTSETVDGAVADWHHDLPGGWGLEASAFTGSWHMIQRQAISDSTLLVSPAFAHNAVGGELWINTPLTGLRVGGGGSHYDVSDVGILPGPWREWHASLDASFSRVVVRSEYRHIKTDQIAYDAKYVYAGVKVLPKLTLHGQLDFADLAEGGPSFSFNTDHAVGASWRFMPSLVLKVEGHTTRGYWADSPLRVIGVDPPARVRYGIVSLSAAF